MNGEVLNLDWRDAPPVKEMLERLFSLLMDIDHRGVARLIASSGLNGKQYARLRKGDNEKEQVNRGSQMLCIDRNGTIFPETQPYSTRAWIYRVHVSTRKDKSLLKTVRVALWTANVLAPRALRLRRLSGYCLD